MYRERVKKEKIKMKKRKLEDQQEKHLDGVDKPKKKKFKVKFGKDGKIRGKSRYNVSSNCLVVIFDNVKFESFYK